MKKYITILGVLVLIFSCQSQKNIAGNFNFNVYSQFILEDADYYLCASPQFIKATKLELIPIEKYITVN
jgi:hypothetical protein